MIEPSNLWLTIHESIGHATELDRALGHEASYAGTTFATTGGLGTLRYGSPAMNVAADRTTPHGLATTGFDDEGVAAQSWELVREGVHVGYQVDRGTAGALAMPRSNGCAYAQSAHHVALQRMPNVSLVPGQGGPATEDLISAVDDGLYVVGSGSWSIDTRRENFQFSAQRYFRIRRGSLVGQVRDLAYQSSTLDFWRSLEAVGGPSTFALFGADLCGKGRPVQSAAASHGSPSALFRSVPVLGISEALA
ncbi:TldD/PmbA family protein [Saccharopolyspora sp. CA-218241]|uniref:TldD/PmbA family protein n=1 Tax=Saccharopolyspora sp. CA-218241 TaxID=3240027 RepID=UPI003D987F64